MPCRFTVLASGSAGNASLLEIEDFGLLLDSGLGPRQLASRLGTFGFSWEHIHAVLLTHTHGDHWNERTFNHLHRRQIPLFCHAEHRSTLLNCGFHFGKLHRDNLINTYEPNQEFNPAPGLRCRALPVCHDAGATFGFRFDVKGTQGQESWAIAYIADLGCWDNELVRALSDVDILALEFNHDVEMQYASGRSPRLIARVLGNEGHLSNGQAVALLKEVIRLSIPGRLQHVIQLHLSRDCNRESLAIDAARCILEAELSSIELHTACQYRAGPCIALGGVLNSKCKHPSLMPARKSYRSQLLLPGWTI